MLSIRRRKPACRVQKSSVKSPDGPSPMRSFARHEAHEAAIGRDIEVHVALAVARGVQLRPIGPQAHSPGGPGLEIAHEHVLRAIGVADNEIPRE